MMSVRHCTPTSVNWNFVDLQGIVVHTFGFNHSQRRMVVYRKVVTDVAAYMQEAEAITSKWLEYNRKDAIKITFYRKLP